MCGLYFPIALVGYACGLELAWMAVMASGMGQPALLYIVPCILLPTALMAYHRGDLCAMLAGIPALQNDNEFRENSLDRHMGSNSSDDDLHNDVEFNVNDDGEI